MLSEKSTVIKSLVLKFLERISYQGIAFIVQLVLARILDPSDFGVITMLTVFIEVSQVFVQSGLNTALVQRKDTTENDYSSVFWVSLMMAIALYGILFVASPFISTFYKMPELNDVLRVLALVLIPGAFNSIQNAKVQREMKFKQLLCCTLISVIISGAVGVTLAYMGFRYWAIVGQQLTNRIVVSILLMLFIKWKPRFIFELERVKVMFSFGWKLLCSSLIDTLYRNLQNLVVGKKYDSSTLGYYNRGNQFPNVIISNVNGSIQTVMLPTLAKHQDDKQKMKSIMRRSIVTSSFIIFPLCVGLAVTANAMISLILTDKWLPCVPYLQAYCFIYAFWPVHTANLQAINAQGRSDWFLRLEIIKKAIGITTLIITVLCFKTPLAIVLGQCFTTLVSCFINAYPNKKLLNYGYGEQMKDIIPSLCIAVAMGICVLTVSLLHLVNWLTLLIQIVVGIAVYIVLAELIRLECYMYLKQMIMKFVKSKKRKRV